MEPGAGKQVDYAYVRHGMVNIFIAAEPLPGKRIIEGHSQLPPLKSLICNFSSNFV